MKIFGQGGSQNPVNSNHDNANTQTSLLYLYRNDNAFACAKYNADVGNPTAACTSGCSSDTNDQNMLSAIADPVSKTATPNALGMGQNGTAAWTLGGVPWNYRQILAHYYKQAKIGSSDNNAYRWTWLNVGSTVAFTGLSGREYYSPKANTPTLMGAGLTYNVPMYIQNTGSSTWNSPYLSYRWYNSANSDVTNSDQILNFLIGSVSPSAAVPSFNASMRGYGQPGTYTVKWDMNQSGTWFSQQNNWPTQNISVQVVPSLNQTLWRGNQAWTRNVLIINGSIDWTTASTWSGPIGLTGIPGSGALRTWTNFRVGNTMIQGYWRGDAEAAQEGRTRSVPITNGVIAWGSAGPWSNPAISISGLPGSGNMQAQSEFVVGNTAWQTFWRVNKGWSRTAPVVNGVIQWSSATAWPQTGIDISALDGSGDMQATENYVIGNTLWQKYWRSNVERTRSTPIVNSVPQFNQASAWSVTTPSTLPSSSDPITGQADYVFP